MAQQQPTVLVRIYAETRDRLDQLKQRKGDYSWSGLESYAQVIKRLADSAKPKKPAADTSR